MTRKYRLTRHAVERYRERVDPHASDPEAEAVLADLAARGRVRPTPRHWMRHTTKRAGSRYLYCADRHDVCLVIVGDAVVTVHSRWVCRRWRAAELLERGLISERTSALRSPHQRSLSSPRRKNMMKTFLKLDTDPRCLQQRVGQAPLATRLRNPFPTNRSQGSISALDEGLLRSARSRQPNLPRRSTSR